MRSANGHLLAPMNSTETTRPAFRVRKRHIVALVIVCLLAFCGIGVAGFFRLGSETRALRGALMRTVAGQWDKRFAVHVGSLTLGLARVGSRFVPLPPEPRAAFDALRGAEVGVYRLQQRPEPVDATAILRAADQAMRERSWSRVVGVVNDNTIVGVYVPDRGRSPGRAACCLMVLQHRNLVVASVRGNLGPLWELAAQRLDSRPRERRS